MKYFICSDIHGDYTGLVESLNEAGFNKKNKDHTLIIVGDIFDRFDESVPLYDFIISIPKSRRILIRGNHDLLYFELLDKKYPERHDWTNGTVDTFCQIANMVFTNNFMRTSNYLRDGYYFHSGTYYDYEKITPEYQKLWDEILNKVKESPITKFLKSDEWKYYYELEIGDRHFIFTHSFIPLTSLDGLPAYYIDNRKQTYRSDWRNATEIEWKDATWGCPWLNYKNGFFKEEEVKGNTLVVGHWHTNDFYKNLKNVEISGCAPIYYSKGLIGLDGGICSVLNHISMEFDYIHEQNIMIIDENGICYDRYRNKLVE